eukprot:scaffold11490_cov67-Phaeocystis_antarctica.AAC.5
MDGDRVDLTHRAAAVPVVPRDEVAEVVERAVVRRAARADKCAHALAVGPPLTAAAAHADRRHGSLDRRPRVGEHAAVEAEVVLAVARVGAVRRVRLAEPLRLAAAGEQQQRAAGRLQVFARRPRRAARRERVDSRHLARARWRRRRWRWRWWWWHWWRWWRRRRQRRGGGFVAAAVRGGGQWLGGSRVCRRRHRHHPAGRVDARRTERRRRSTCKRRHDPRQPVAQQAGRQLRRREVDGLLRRTKAGPRRAAHRHAAQPPRVRQRRAQPHTHAARGRHRRERQRQRHVDAHGIRCGAARGRVEGKGDAAVARRQTGGEERLAARR